jgi:site-specific recombinase XerD
MATFRVAIRLSELKANGSANVKIRVTHNRAARYISTDYDVIPKFFDEGTGKILPGGGRTADEAGRHNNRIQIDIGIIASKIDKHRDNIKNMDISSLMTILRDKRREYELLSLMDDRINKYKKTGNANYMDSYKVTKGIVKDFAGSIVPFESVTHTWLTRLEFQMKLNGLKPNSIGVHMRNIRTCYNQAITMGLIDLSAYPFRQYRIPKEQTRKRNLSSDEIAKIYRLEIKEPLMAWARDMFILSFFLIGINMKDLFLINNVEEDRIYYIRSKGKKPYSIKVFPEAKAILDKYPGKKYLINTMDNYSDYRTATKRINYKLKDIATLCKIEKPVSTYYCRHSWATIGRSIKIAKDDISLGLGHQRAKLEMTEIYIDEEQEIIDQANRSIIDHILKTPLSE